jgi:hypothetical protein
VKSGSASAFHFATSQTDAQGFTHQNAALTTAGVNTVRAQVSQTAFGVFTETLIAGDHATVAVILSRCLAWRLRAVIFWIASVHPATRSRP